MGPTAEEARVIGGRYKILSRIGAGGMGTVWRAQDLLLRRTVAVKEICLPQAIGLARDELRERTMREARAAAQLAHPNVVTVHDVIEEDGQPWIVMQLVESNSLAQVLASSGRLPPRTVARIGVALLSGLNVAHAAGILHRDVKPANVLLGRDGSVVLTDFGVASLEGDPSLTGTGLLLGSPAYMAPERALGKPTGPASDLWSLGATLYEAVEGRTPFDRSTPIATLAALATELPSPPLVAGPLTAVLDGLLQRDPERRLDATRTRQLLEAVLAADDDAPTIVGRVPGERPRTHAAATTHPGQQAEVNPVQRRAPAYRRPWVVLALLAVLLGAVALFVTQGRDGAATRNPNAQTTRAPSSAGTAVSDTPSPAASTPPASTDASDLPESFVGRWSGRVDQSGQVYTADLQLRGGTFGGVVGTSRYPELGCSGELTLLARTGANRVHVAEKILAQAQPGRCVPAVTIDLELSGASLRYSGEDQGGFTGNLTRRTPG